MKYRNAFDHLGNPYAKREDREGVWIIIGCIAAVIIAWRWLA
jgi:lipid-A-disaccharide synthase-like uncharacterized protein